MKFLIKIFNKKTDKNHFLTTVIDTQFYDNNLIEQSLIGKKFYFDTNRTKILGVCNKIEIINIIK